MSIWNGVALAVLAGCLYWFTRKQRLARFEAHRKAKEDSLPTREVENDRIIVIHCNSEQYVNQLVLNACDAFNTNTYDIVCRLYSLGSGTYALRFPFGIAFNNFCFLVNYLQYPNLPDVDETVTVTGWTSLRSSDKESESVQAYATGELMVYNPKDEYYSENCSFITTQEGVQFALELDLIQPIEQEGDYEIVKKDYRPREIEIKDLEGKEIDMK